MHRCAVGQGGSCYSITPVFLNSLIGYINSTVVDFVVHCLYKVFGSLCATLSLFQNIHPVPAFESIFMGVCSQFCCYACSVNANWL